MNGNVWEWVQDWYGDYPSNSVPDPKGPDEGQYRVLRGGSWFNIAWNLRSALRSRSFPDYRISDIGFRVAHAPACLIIQVLPESDTSRRVGESMLYIEKLYWFRKNFEFVMPVPDQVRDDGSGIQNLLKLLDSGLRRNDALMKF